jgi:hypothetical protein
MCNLCSMYDNAYLPYIFNIIAFLLRVPIALKCQLIISFGEIIILFKRNMKFEPMPDK